MSHTAISWDCVSHTANKWECVFHTANNWVGFSVPHCKQSAVCVPHSISMSIAATSKCFICVSVYAYGHPHGSNLTNLPSILLIFFAFFAVLLVLFVLVPCIVPNGVCVSELSIHDCYFVLSNIHLFSNPGYCSNTFRVAT